MAEQQKYLLGLDAGNTVIKAVLFDLSGNEIAKHALDGQSSTPQPGHVERDLDELWRNACQAIAGCIERAGIAAADIVGIGCAGHGNGLYLLDKQDAPLLAFQSLDTRAAGMAGELSQQGNGEQLHAICLQKPWPSQTPTLLAWIKANRPDIYAETGTVFLCKDFITFNLTGEKVSDISDMSGCGFLSMPDCTYDDRLLELYGLEDAADSLPRLIGPADIAGTVSEQAARDTGLNSGTPVVGGLFDVVASALGSGAVHPGQASIIAGTWSINQVLSDAPVVDDNVFMVSGFGTNRFVNIEASATSAANLEWYVREFIERGEHHDDPFGYCNQRVGSVQPTDDDPLFHPFLYGSGQGAQMRAGFYGIAGWHNEGHLLRALFEGVVFEHRRHIEQLTSAGVEFGDAVLSGGGSRSPIWPQMFADCMGKSMTVAACEETGALGAAIAAGCGSGLFDTLDAGVAAMTSARQTFDPDPSMQAHYQRRYEIFTQLTASMNGFWSAQQNLK
ncbi:MAG: FGGY-family carbohydrate kinase [Rhizobiaceae bacterium]